MSPRRLVPATRRSAPPPVFETEYEPVACSQCCGSGAGRMLGRCSRCHGSGVAPGEIVPTAPRGSHWSDNLAAKIRSTPPWVLFLWLAATAVVYAYVGKLILFIIAVVLFVRGWIWLSWRFPMTMIFVNSFIAALLGGRRRRRW